MVVDCHTHISCIGMENLEVSEHLEAAEVVDKCIVLASAQDSVEKVNVRLSEYVTKYPQKMVGFAVVDPLAGAVTIKTLKAVTVKMGLKGIVLYCSERGFHPADSRAMQLYDSAQQLTVPVFFHNVAYAPGAVLEYAQPYLLDEVARSFPGLKMVIGNMGLPFGEQTICLLAKHENIYADLSIKPGNSWQVYNLVVAAHEQGVMDKLLFGSAFPVARAQQCMETLLGFNKMLAEAKLPAVPRGNIQGIIERDTLALLGIER